MKAVVEVDDRIFLLNEVDLNRVTEVEVKEVHSMKDMDRELRLRIIDASIQKLLKGMALKKEKTITLDKEVKDDKEV